MHNTRIRTIQAELAKAIKGQVLDSGDIGYATAIQIDNGRVSHEPFLIALPSNSVDVSKIVQYCFANEIQLTVKSGGHSANGYSLNSKGIVLDLSSLNSITPLSAEYLRVETGAKWIKVYNYLKQRHSKKIVVGGGCPGVGLGGFLLGGGYSFVSRSYGLGVDSIKALEFVDVKGEIHQLNGQSKGKEKDLLWALKGAGGGNFGIVTSVDIKTHDTPSPRMMMGQISFPFYRIKEILTFYNEWVLSLPDEMAIYGMMRYFPDSRLGGKRVLSLRFTPIYNGPLSEGLKLIQPLADQAPKGLELHDMTIPEWENFIGSVTLIKGRAAYIRSLTLPPKSLTSDFAETCMKYMGRSPSQESYIVWTHMGGAIRNYGLDTSCFAHRDAEFTFELKSIWDAEKTQLMRKNVTWAVQFFDELETHNALGAYINYIDPLLPDWQKKYYRHTYQKLLEIKDHWDPDGKFNFQQGIGSSFQPDRNEPINLSPLNRTIT